MKTIISIIIFLLGISEAFAIDGRRYDPQYLKNQYQHAHGLLNFLDSYGIDSGVVIDQLRDKENRYARAYAVSKYGYHNIRRSDATFGNWAGIDVKKAWTQGYDGSGVTVNIIDDWRDRHFTQWGYSWDVPAHGKYVKSILSGDTIGRSTFIGIAPEAEVTETSMYGLANAQSRYEYDVVNMSYGATVNFNSHEEYQDLLRTRGAPYSHIDTDAVRVVSAGNSRSSCKPGGGCNSSAFEHVGSAADQTLVVGSITNGGNMRSHSNKAGLMKDNYVVDVDNYHFKWTNEAGNNRQWASRGTSFAAPTVSGKVALMRHKYPNLNASQIVNIVKQTADDLGAPGVDEIYGHGRVNLTRALSPVGTLR